MNIEMINNHSANRMVDVDKSQYGNPSSTDSRMKTKEMGYSLDITGTVMENAAYGKEELKSAQDIAQAAGNQNVTLQRNYAAVMSNSMSAEDYAELTKDGINPNNTDVKESVTNLDKIKIKMAEAGMTIEGYNDDLTSEEISAVVGNQAMAEALAVGNQLEPLTDEACKYMLVNDLEPTIENIYKAEHSSGVDIFSNAHQSETNWDELKDQALEIVEQSNVEIEDGMEDAKWIVEHDVPLTKDTIEAYDKITNIQLPPVEEDLIKAISIAVDEGKSPIEADITQTESLYDKAVRIVNDFAKMEDGGDLTKRRQLEEVRLAMTAEANLTLLRKGIDIEIQPLVELVDKLKQAEVEFYRPVLLDESYDSSEKPLTSEESKLLSDRIELYKATRNVIEDIPGIPVEEVAKLSVDENASENDFNIDRLHREGVVSRDAYVKAGETYEALMTAPRADMGDSIRKAFANVDDILEDIGIDINDTNRQAVRTLGYAQMEINKESVERVREATNAVKAVITLMTPAKTLQMIREGHNPLKENIFELEKSLSEESPLEASEKYSQFLWKLEKNGQITDDEKSAYIGMYRLFNQIEKQDGKVIGNILANGMELTMQNMLAASRSNRSRNMDIKIDDEFGVLEDVIAKGESISDQISKGFVQMITEPVAKEYVEEKLEDTKKAAKLKGTAEEILKTLEEPVTVENILAVSDMVALGGRQYKRLFDNGRDRDTDNSRGEEVSKISGEEVLSEDEIETLLDDFNDRASAQSAYELFTGKAMTIANLHMEESDSLAELREWTLINRQLGFSSKLGRHESYDIPLKTEDGYTAIHLTVKSGSEGAGKVTASFETKEYGRVNAVFTMKESGVDGFVVTDSRAGVSALEAKKGNFISAFADNNIGTHSMSIVYGRNVQEQDYVATSDDVAVSNKELYSVAKAFLLAIAE